MKTCCRRWRREGIVLRGLKDLTDADKRHLRRVVPPRNLPGADAAGHRPGPSVPAPAQQVAQPRRHAAHGRGDEEQAVRRRAGAGRAAALRAAAGRAGATPRYVFAPLETVIRMHLPDLFPGMTHRARDAVFRVTRNSEIRNRRRRSRGPAQDHRGRGAQAPPRRRGAPGDRGRRARRRSSSS